MRKNPKSQKKNGVRTRVVPSPRRTLVIDPTMLTVESAPSGVELHFNGHRLLLADSSPLSHPKRALIEHIRDEFSGYGTVTLGTYGQVKKPAIISSYFLLSEQRHIEANQNHPFVTGFRKWVLLDPCLSPCAGPEIVDQYARWHPLSLWYEEQGLTPPHFAQVPIDVDAKDDADVVLRKRLRQILGKGFRRDNPVYQNAIEFVDSVDKAFRRLGPEEWAAMSFLYQCHEVVLFPLLLVMGRCTAQEYANGVMAANCILTTLTSDVSAEAHENISRGYREDAQVMLQFLEHARCPWAKEIINGEDDTREFKATLRYDLATSLKNTELEHALLKNVTAFMNTRGGTLFVGVKDDGEIFGIELDDFPNNDKWGLHLITRIGQQIGKRFLPLCTISFDVLHGKTVARIDIQASQEPAFLDERALKAKGIQNAFFIRGCSSAQRLDGADVSAYISKHFLPSSTQSSPNPTPNDSTNNSTALPQTGIAPNTNTSP